MEPKWEPKSIKNQENPEKNEVRKTMRKNSAPPGSGGSSFRHGPGPGAPKATY